LSDWAKTLTGDAQQQRFVEADQRYAEATRLKPDYVDAYNNWGNALSDWAQTLTGEAQQQRFAEADQRYAEATRLVPDNADAYYNWGTALLGWAQTLTGEAQQQRFAEADQRYAEATRLKPDFAKVYYNWGSALLHWVHTLPSDERAAKLDEAERVLLLAKEKGSYDLYNLACLSAIQQRPDETRVLLEATRATGLLPDFAHLSTDRDLENLRGLDWFQALLADVQQKEAASQAAA
jgi:tetratricopeptide (TPR) repeat protein